MEPAAFDQRCVLIRALCRYRQPLELIEGVLEPSRSVVQRLIPLSQPLTVRGQLGPFGSGLFVFHALLLGLAWRYAFVSGHTSPSWPVGTSSAGYQRSGWPRPLCY
eukprot:scaffold24322_cov81-Phaeocystis_antarctica.AAC.8